MCLAIKAAATLRFSSCTAVSIVVCVEGSSKVRTVSGGVLKEFCATSVQVNCRVDSS